MMSRLTEIQHFGLTNPLGRFLTLCSLWIRVPAAVVEQDLGHALVHYRQPSGA